MSDHMVVLLYSILAVANFAFAERVALRALLGKVKAMRPSENSLLRSIFQWKAAAVVLPLLLGAGITLAIDHQFRMAYTFFVLFGLWGILSWLLSDTLRQARSHRVIVKYAGIVVIIAFSGWWINWVHDLHLELIADRLKAARQETFDKLTVVPVPLLSQDSSDQIAMSITNVAHWELDQHRLDCQISSLSYTNHAVFSQAFIHGHSTKQMGLLGGGRGEVAYCDIPMGGPPDAGVACIDMDVQVTFALLEQPNESMVKPYRFSGGLGPMGLTWIQQSLGGKTDPCS